MFSDDTLQTDSPALGVGETVRGQDLSPGLARHQGGLGPQGHSVLAPLGGIVAASKR